jgi:hypothetical protein
MFGSFRDLAFLGAAAGGGVALPNIGDPFEGGFFAGLISHTADGNPTHALIVAPRATGATGTGYELTTNQRWKTTNTTTAGATSVFDGAANTAAMVTAGIAEHPAAEFCVNLSIGGFTDWYLPARFELAIAYFNLKNTTGINSTSVGINNYSVPMITANYTTSYPSITPVSIFNNPTQRFSIAYHWMSNQTNATDAPFMVWGNESTTNGGVGSISKTAQFVSVRAFRRIAL